MIPFADSEELVCNSDLPPETLIEIGDDHRLADPEPLKAILDVCVCVCVRLTNETNKEIQPVDYSEDEINNAIALSLRSAMSDQHSTGKKIAASLIVGAATWGMLIVVSIVLENLLNPPAPRGLQAMPPFPAIFLSALSLGWIPAMMVGVWTFRRMGKSNDPM